ncbi:MAG TPA: hypothetical protein VMS22_22500 [Candidatus Eisenbacteria bacterium]|nr:hypothetical protein [Candidatus Eisenbacteria bacterium]
MTIRATRLSLALLLALGAIPAFAEHEGDHAQHGTQTVTLDGNDVRPSTTNLAHGDVVSFVNYSVHPIKVVFTDPADLKEKIHCGLVKGAGGAAADSPPWALFTWENDKLVGTLPPGRFASVCSLEPGAYAFTAMIVGGDHKGAGPGSILPAKGQIVVK